jgi:acyl-CoA thioesterase-1
MTDTPRPCKQHLDLVGFKYRLPHLTESLKRQRKIKIVAIGSSSTAGEDPVIPFPFRLQLALRSRYPGRMIDVVNRGIGGQEAPEEFSRFESDVIAEAPTLTIWQVGTNAIFHKDLYNPPAVAGTIATGVSVLKGLPTDVILMDLQFVPALLQDNQGNKDPQKEHDTRLMVSLIAAVAKTEEVNLFPRFALMEQWCVADGVPLADLINPADPLRLHMSEWATQCVTSALDSAIAKAVGPVPGAPPPTA